MYVWQGGPADSSVGDCAENYGRNGGWAWACTLPAGHRGMHEAWGTHGTAPIAAWGMVEDKSKPKMQYTHDGELHVQIDSGEAAAALNKMIDEALAALADGEEEA